MKDFQQVYKAEIELFSYGFIVIITAILTGLLVKAVVNYYQLNEHTAFPGSKLKKPKESQFMSNSYYLLTMITVVALLFTPKVLPKETLEFIVYRLWSITLLLTVILQIAHYLSKELLELFENSIIQDKLNQWFYDDKPIPSKDNISLLTAHLSGLFVYVFISGVGGFIAIIAILNSDLLTLLINNTGKLIFFVLFVGLFFGAYRWMIKLPPSPYHKPLVLIACLFAALILSKGSFMLAFLLGVVVMFYLKDNQTIPDIIAGWFLMIAQRKQALINNETVDFNRIGLIKTTVIDLEGDSEQLRNSELLTPVANDKVSAADKWIETN